MTTAIIDTKQIKKALRRLKVAAVLGIAVSVVSEALKAKNKETT